MSSLQSKTALITGANNPLGIGAAVAKSLSGQGLACFLTYLRRPGQLKELTSEEIEKADAAGMPLYTRLSMKSAEEVVNEIIEAGGKAWALEVDLSDPESITRIFEEAEANFGPVEVLINNAAHCPAKDRLADLSAEEIDLTYAVNVRASLLLIKEFVSRYKSHKLRSGRIVSISTGPAQKFAGQIAYGSSKAALEAATRAIAPEIGPLGITINVVAPGPTQTGYIDSEMETELVRTIPMRRLGEPKDIASTIKFLASPEAEWITGQVIRVTGGRDV